MQQPDTPDQQRALEWLPDDGSWREAAILKGDEAERLAGAVPIQGLELLIRQGFCMGTWDGAQSPAFRLTPSGMALKAERKGASTAEASPRLCDWPPAAVAGMNTT